MSKMTGIDHLPHDIHLAELGSSEKSGNNGPTKPESRSVVSLQKGLAKLYDRNLTIIYVSRNNGFITQERAESLINQIDELSLQDLGYEISKCTSIENAQEIMGSDMFFGPEEVRKAGIEIKEDVPVVPFSPDELIRALNLGQMLIYRTSTTMKELDTIIGPNLIMLGKGNAPDDSYWYKDENFYKSEKIQPGWALVSKEITPGTETKDYIPQLEILATYLVNEVFKGMPLPREYQEAIDQFNDQKNILLRLINNLGGPELQKAGQMMVDLKINQLFRQSVAEVIYDCFIYFRNTGKRLYIKDLVWTNTLVCDSTMPVYAGRFDDRGAHIPVVNYYDSFSNSGAFFCRRGADLKS